MLLKRLVSYTTIPFKFTTSGENNNPNATPPTYFKYLVQNLRIHQSKRWSLNLSFRIAPVPAHHFVVSIDFRSPRALYETLATPRHFCATWYRSRMLISVNTMTIYDCRNCGISLISILQEYLTSGLRNPGPGAGYIVRPRLKAVVIAVLAPYRHTPAADKLLWALHHSILCAGSSLAPAAE